MWKEKLQKLIANGHLRRIQAPEWFRLSEEDCKELSMKALENPPLTFMTPTRGQKNLLRSDLAQGLLPGLRSEDIALLTADEAEILLSISAENRWNGKRRYGEIIQREQTDTETATPEQLQKIRELIQEKFLHPLSGNTLLKISRLSAKRLIWKGEMNRRKTCHT